MRRLLVLSVMALLIAAPTSPAFAHAAYESSDPNDGSTVSQPPSRVIADFTERLNPDASSLSVYDPCGTRVDRQDSLIANDRITVSMSADKQGTYVVRFEVLSAVDGHPTSGQFSFTSSGGSPCPEEAGEEEEQEPREPPSEDGTRDDDSSRTEERQELRETGTEEQRRREARADGETLRDGSKTREKSDRRDDRDIAAPSTGEVDLELEEAGIWDGIPIGDFLVSLGVAALIGAAGGRIYAGIIGPRR